MAKANCRKPEVKCNSCQHRTLLSLTDHVLFEHLSGRKTIGIYPLLKDETCTFLALDFDKKHWQEDVSVFIQSCQAFNIPVHIERSRSGNGGHVWIFFSESISASLARRFGEALLLKALENRHEIGMDSFDRMFPNQDTLPKGGIGNLIALPLQLESKKAGNSVFVDKNFIAYQDQWMYLSSIRKLAKKDILFFISKLNNSALENLKSIQPSPQKISIYIKNGLYIRKETIPSTLYTKIISLASFNNPEFYKAQAKRLSTYKLQKFITCADEDSEHIILPRGCLEDLKSLFKENSFESEFIDEQYGGENVNVLFKGTLHPQQEEAVNELFNHGNGVLSATTGFGKTVLAAALIAKRKTNTLIIVDRTQLLTQWIEKLAFFLNISPKEIGQFSGNKKKLTGKIDIATIQSLRSKGEIQAFITQYGQVIVDKCHHISAVSFEKTLKSIRAKHVYGLTATPSQKDGLHPIIFMQCGPIRYKADAKNQSMVSPFKQKLFIKKTIFSSASTNIQDLYNEISVNKLRNQQLFNDVLHELEAGRSPMILTERIEHLEILEQQFKGFAKNIIVLSGKLTKKEQTVELKRLTQIPDHEERLIIATGKYIGEGFDDPRLDTLFLAMPISWKGTLQQYVGRLHRIHTGKEEVRVFDYVDIKITLLKKMFEKRMTGYKSFGYKLDDGLEQTEQMRLF
nr:DEAD/DEAH box helicase family protein [Bacillus sp. S/N-304-OC-R1]